MGINNTPQTSFASRLGEDTITLFVGPDRQKFTVHKKLICTLPYFRAAFEGGFVERNGKMDLPEEKPEMMALFVGWIYQGKIESIYTQSHVNNLFYLCIFAEKICEVRLMDMTIDAIQDISLACNAKLEPKTFFDVCQNTPVQSNITDFCIALYAQQMTTVRIVQSDMKLAMSSLQELWKYVREDQSFFCCLMFGLNRHFHFRKKFDVDIRQRGEIPCTKLPTSCRWHTHEIAEKCPLDEDGQAKEGK
ncbi:hypothetical protein HYALB_00005918 [Hymenoscyphus albidus]|uniref:BTB domain-containing protein n=1 Tax=Hymenoscyphus albidus TaxID=595503 RepID=A0A9N9Q8C6_9HELO|nr:hypothetical protein HYALB_00005918 [Hymenoscyphus albidus]